MYDVAGISDVEHRQASTGKYSAGIDEHDVPERYGVSDGCVADEQLGNPLET